MAKTTLRRWRGAVYSASSSISRRKRYNAGIAASEAKTSICSWTALSRPLNSLPRRAALKTPSTTPTSRRCWSRCCRGERRSLQRHGARRSSRQESLCAEMETALPRLRRRRGCSAWRRCAGHSQTSASASAARGASNTSSRSSTTSPSSPTAARSSSPFLCAEYSPPVASASRRHSSRRRRRRRAGISRPKTTTLPRPCRRRTTPTQTGKQTSARGRRTKLHM
mmetsp:Transcript_11610/g.38806  ORF Transcript_11610/g.38806 Transcript_11610/m.38806 type:complete len:224 (+) Transcript_11610:1351-2022(+)